MQEYYNVFDELKKDIIIDKNNVMNKTIIAKLLIDDNLIIDNAYYIVMFNEKLDIIKPYDFIYDANIITSIINVPFESEEIAVMFLTEYPDIYEIINHSFNEHNTILSYTVKKAIIKYQIKEYFKQYL